MTEDLNVFPNAKSPLFGAGEDSIGIITTPAVAGLTGSSSINTTEQSGGSVSGGSTFAGNTSYTNFIDEVTLFSTNITLTANQQVVIAISASTRQDGAGNAVPLDVYRDTTLLFTATAPKNSTVLDLFVDNPGAGTFSYNVEPNTAGGTAQLRNVQTRFIILTLNDDHEGFIQSVAIAGKQINAADSHTTREISVLPG